MRVTSHFRRPTRWTDECTAILLELSAEGRCGSRARSEVVESQSFKKLRDAFGVVHDIRFEVPRRALRALQLQVSNLFQVAARAAPTFLASSVERCQQLKGQLSPRQKAKAPIITSADFTKDASLLPDPKKYEQWDTMFVSITRNEGVNFWKAQDPSEGA